ncbi:spondin domain-containing protein [Vibrio hippocampi]|uniref:Spondin domain-containing protein n=1 Tax=Vibrio hippocampi TaxID=654686 RepID=A0ABN8DJ27_9VIBR|nr:spondin domain-containing protein [Vibrio hippocampi]CAH0529219.1 hypothetical protein VHP8226_03110 [Vibrio hippocampi]
MKLPILTAAIAAALLVGCSDDDNDSSSTRSSDEAQYRISFINLTPNQPMSPLAIVTHNEDFSLFTVGSSASVELEHLAEGGSNAEVIALMNSDSNVDFAVSGNGLVMPGASDEVTVTVSSGYLSLASMLVNTNDAFVGETGLSLMSLSVGESYQMTMNVWDSGTELNDELASTIPGPAGGGEGFNSARNDTSDIVTFHSGVISADDGLASSALSANHRFVNPGAQITITRLD